MRSKLKRSKRCKNVERSIKDQGQTNEVIEISSESGCSDIDTAFDNNLTSGNNNQNISNTDTGLAPIFLRTKKTSKGVSGYSRPHILEVNSSSTCQKSDKLLISDLDVRLRDVQISNPTFSVNNIFSILHKKGCPKEQDFTSGDKEHFQPVQNKENFHQDNAHQRSSFAEEDLTTTIFPPSHVVQDSTMPSPEKLHRTNRLSRTRRLRHGSITLNDITQPENKKTKETKSDQRPIKTPEVFQREPFSEDVLWTDKYSPRHSSEIIGNRPAVEKLHSWLIKWKLKSNVEDKKEKQNRAQSNESWDCGDFEDEVGSEDETEEQLCNTVLISGPPGVGKTASVYACALELGFKVFEVNCSSQRSGREVLARLKEATQSHLVEIGKDPLKPAFFNSYGAVRSTAAFDTLPVKTPKKTTVSTSKKNPVQNRFNCKESTKPITLTSYFKMKAKADHFYHSGASPSKKNTKCTNAATSEDHIGTTNKKMTKSLILFEEVDVIFKDDVGFFAAIKTFMRTTKRPVVLTTTDPLFRERFNSSLEEIIFQTPSMADVCSYLRLVCLAENVQLDPDDVKTLFTATQGDVRRCLLQLQFWTNSGAGRGSHKITEGEFTYKACSANMLGLQYVTKNNLLQLLQPTLWTAQQMTEILQPVTESWRNGFPILYSNLELLENKVDNTCSGPDGKMLFCDTQQIKTTSGQYSTRSAAKTKSRLSRKKNILSQQKTQTKKAQCVTDKLETANSLTALSDFFDIISFIDATIPATQQLVATPCNLNEFIWTGAKIQDGLLDELDEIEEEEDKKQEMMLDIRATLEALGFHQCWRQVSDTGVQRLSHGAETSNTKNLNLITQHLDPHIVSQRLDLNQKILSSRYFNLIHNKCAVCIDYLPFMRFICRTHRKWKKWRAEEIIRCVKAFRTQLRLTKETVQLLAREFS